LTMCPLVLRLRRISPKVKIDTTLIVCDWKQC
jgi:hypothetical protein